MSGGLLTPQGQAWRSGSESEHMDAAPFCDFPLSTWRFAKSQKRIQHNTWTTT
jgi:hypothetical protein